MHVHFSEHRVYAILAIPSKWQLWWGKWRLAHWRSNFGVAYFQINPYQAPMCIINCSAIKSHIKTCLETQRWHGFLDSSQHFFAMNVLPGVVNYFGFEGIFKSCSISGLQQSTQIGLLQPALLGLLSLKIPRRPLRLKLKHIVSCQPSLSSIHLGKLHQISQIKSLYFTRHFATLKTCWSILGPPILTIIYGFIYGSVCASPVASSNSNSFCWRTLRVDVAVNGATCQYHQRLISFNWSEHGVPSGYD